MKIEQYEEENDGFARLGSYYVMVQRFWFSKKKKRIDIGMTGELTLDLHKLDEVDECFYAFKIYASGSFDNRFVHGGI